MSDDASAPATPAPPPIEVPIKTWPVLTNEALRVIALGMFAVVADRFVHHDMLLPAIMAGAAFVATWLIGVVQHIHTVGLFKAINELVPDRLIKAKP